MSNLKHPDHVAGYSGSLDELAQSVGNMRYDRLSLFLTKLAADLKKQSDADQKRRRKRLAKKLKAASEKLVQAKEEIESAWEICQPYM